MAVRRRDGERVVTLADWPDLWDGKRYLIAIDSTGKAYLRKTVAITRDLHERAQRYDVLPANAKTLHHATRKRLLAAVQKLLCLSSPAPLPSAVNPLTKPTTATSGPPRGRTAAPRKSPSPKAKKTPKPPRRS